MFAIQKTIRRYVRTSCLLLIGFLFLHVCGCVSLAPPSPPRVFIDAEVYDLRATSYQDPDCDLSQQKKYAFEYTHQDNPLLEKELFKMLADVLSQKGMVRDEVNPDVLITMHFYVGRRESYVPPKTITTTRIENIWSTGMFGMTVTGQAVPVPVTESQTTPGYTEISYYKNIRVNFLDYAKLKSGEKLTTPPLMWIGEVERTGKDSDIRNDAASMLRSMVLGPQVRIKCGSIKMEGTLRGKHLVVQAINAIGQTLGHSAGIHVHEVVRAIHGVAPADYIHRWKEDSWLATYGVKFVYTSISNNTVTRHYFIEGSSVELEVENQETAAVRKGFVQ